jgi:prepilin-type N-terminal cleavage/methylation domain-containing protein
MRSQAGFSLTEILVAVGLLSVITLAMLTMLTTQNKELSSIDEKMALQTLQIQLTNLLQNPSFCGCFIGNNKFNSTTHTWNSFPTEIGSSYDNTCAIVGAPLVKENERIGTSKMVPTDIRLENITETLVNTGRYSSNLVVAMDQNQLTRIRKNISIPFSFQLNMVDAPANRSLSACSVSSTTSSGFCNWNPLGPDSRFGEFICPGTGTVKGIKTEFCDSDGSPSDYCFSVYCCY